MTKHLIGAALIGAFAIGAVAPATAQDHWDWRGGGRDDHRIYRLIGPGVRLLIPELRDTDRGRAFVLRNFDRNRDNVIAPREAEEANHAFLSVAGRDPRHFDWDRHVTVIETVPPPPGPPPHVVWDRGAMHNYHFRQTRYGATFAIDDVFFATDSASLRPTALAKLRPAADYMRANPGVQVRIDGYTDSRASDAYNQRLSEARAQSVEEALVRMGVPAARFHVEGHGERDPVATNTTAAGRQQNRRVEITLVGQRADRF